MNDPTIRFDDVDLDTWRAKLERDGRSAASLTHAGLDGIDVEALYDRVPARPVVVPPRAGWACLQVLPAAPAQALAVARALPSAQVEGVWIASSDAAAIVAGLPAGLAAYVEGDGVVPGATACVVDPCAPFGGSAVRRIDAAIERAAARPLRTWLCDGTPWHDAGATAVDEIACVLAGVIGALRGIEARTGASPSEAAPALLMRVGLGGDVLVDVAKLRALRGLWHACAGELGIDTAAIPVHARTARRVRSRLDADTNLVRATYELFAAATTGVDAIVVEPHDGGAADGSHRWARNLVHLMRHESHLGRVDDPFGGAFAIESLTRALADAAWRRVQEIERDGGLAAAVDAGDPQRRAAAAAGRRRAAIAAGTHPLVGVSKYAPPPPRETPTVPDDAFGPVDLCAPYEVVAGGAR